MLRTVTCLLLFALTCSARGSEDLSGLGAMTLRDSSGVSRQIDAERGGGLLVLAVTDVGCPISGKYGPRLAGLQAAYAERGVRFLALDASPQDSVEEVARFAEAVGFSFPVLLDDEQRLARALGARTTTEVFVIDRAGRLAYRGAIDDQYEVGAARPEPTHHFLVEALEAVLGGKRPETTETRAPGCVLTYLQESPAVGSITWSNTIASLLQRRCETCHREEGGAPFALSTYEKARGWSGMLAEVVAEGRMPPWKVDEEYHGLFRNERRLTGEELAQLLQWVRDGAPRGNPEEDPEPIVWKTGLQIGEPDAHIFAERFALVDAALPAEGFPVPRQGIVPYQYFTAQTNFDEDKWIRAVEVTSDVPDVVHHIILMAEDPSAERRSLDAYRRFLAVRAPGEHSEVYPETYARRLPQGARLLFQVHYNPDGAEHRDIPGVAMIFADEPPQYEIVTDAAANEQLVIPAGAPAHEVRADYMVSEDIGLLALIPHMHSRGSRFQYVAHFPDGESRELLSCDFDVTWQESYILNDPIPLPKGTRLEAIGVYDNTAANPNNPDPTKSVRWGSQTWEEMLIGYFNYVRPVPQD